MAIKPTIAVMLSNCSINLSAVLISKLFGSLKLHIAPPAQNLFRLLQRFSRSVPSEP